MGGDSGLADTLAGGEHGQRRQRKRFELGRLEPEVSPGVGDPGREHPAGHPEPRRGPQHGLVGQVEHELRLQLPQRPLEIGVERDAVVGFAAELLRPAGHERADELVRQLDQSVAHRRRVVLPVDQGQRPHRCEVTSPSILAVYFSNERVSVENWMIFSCPWNGYFRQTSTWWSVISIRL